MRQLFVLLLCAMVLVTDVMAQTATAPKSKPKRFHGNPDYFLEVQGTQLYRHVDKALDAEPPMVNASLARKSALFCLDALMHDVRYDNSEAMREFTTSRTEKLLADLGNPFKKGLKIYKVYNDGFLARTKTVCIAFDIVRGTYLARGKHKDTDYRIVRDEQMRAIVDRCDALFLSHRHADHVDRWVVEAFIAAGKPVVAAPDILPDVEGIKRWRADEGVFEQTLVLKSGKRLQVRIFPGHQSSLLNNVSVVTTPDGYTVCHTGDQFSRNDMGWIADVKNNVPIIDVLMVNCWTYRITKMLQGFDARYVVTGHENEMGHSIDHRESFWLTFDKLKGVEYPYVVMTLGEWFSIK